MPIIKPRFLPLTGVSQIDQHHDRLVRLVNRAYDQFSSGAILLPPLIDELLDACAGEFTWEEGLMAESGYPDAARHHEEHAFFTATLLAVRDSTRPAGEAATELLWFLCGWVTHHLAETDAGLGRHLAAAR